MNYRKCLPIIAYYQAKETGHTADVKKSLKTLENPQKRPIDIFKNKLKNFNFSRERREAEQRERERQEKERMEKERLQRERDRQERERL